MPNAQALVEAALERVSTRSVAEAQALHGRDDVLFVDLREAAERKRDGTIPGAAHVPRGVVEFQADPTSDWHRAELTVPGRELLLFCAIGWRSALAAAALADLGHPKVAHVGGGFEAWRAAGGAVEAVEPTAVSDAPSATQADAAQRSARSGAAAPVTAAAEGAAEATKPAAVAGALVARESADPPAAVAARDAPDAPATPTLLQSLRIQAHANRLANHRLHAALAALDAAELHAPRTGFFPSLLATLNHVLAVDGYYVAALCGDASPDAAWHAFRPADALPDLRDRQRASDERLIGWLDRADAAALGATVALPRGGGVVQRDRAAHVLQHLFMHQTHHRGQAHAMLSGTAVAPPQLDEFLMPSEAHLRRAEMAAHGYVEAAVYGAPPAS